MKQNFSIRVMHLCFLIFALFCLPLFSIAQLNQPSVATDLVSILSPSPNASALGKFMEVPVGEYTGIPNINIPIWTISQGDINVDISLSYHAGGIKVDDIASYVGTGWNLNNGGVITRSTRGLPDSYSTQQDINRFRQNLMTQQERESYMLSVFRGTADSEPDLYYVNCGDLSFSFFEDETGTFQQIPYNPNVRIQQDINGFDWIITSGKGIRYRFSQREYSESDSRFRGASGTESDASYFSGVSSWYVSEIEDSKANKITFQYVSNDLNYLTRGMEKVKIPETTLIECQKYSEFSYSYNAITSKKLKSITFQNGSVNFYEGAARLDCNGDKSIDRIEVVNSNNELIKRMRFYTSYFENNTFGTGGMNIYSAMDQKRLRLDSLIEESSNSILRPYKFGYFFNIGLPYRNSNAQDHWGYFNGKNNSTSVSYYENVGGLKSGANKDVSEVFTKECTLSSVTYPTGGTTELDLEGNRFTTMDNSITETDNLVGFLRGNNDNTSTDFHSEQNFTIGQTVLQGSSDVSSTVSFYTEGVSPSCSCTVTATLTKPDATVITLHNGQIISLVAGNYTIKADITTEFAGNPYVYFDVNITAKVRADNSQVIDVAGPGLRIKKITKKSFTSPDIVEQYSYIDSSTGKTSGQVANIPAYLSNISVASGSGGTAEYFCNFRVYASASNCTLINSKSSYVGYSYVDKKILGPIENGRVLSHFNNHAEASDINSSSGFPFPPNASQDWKRGVLLNKIVYDSNNQIKSKESYHYDVIPNTAKSFYGIKIASTTQLNYAANNQSIINTLQAVSYPIITDKYALISDTTIEINNGIELMQSNFYNYSVNDFNLSKSEQKTSDGSSKIKYLFYPKDYSNSSGTSPLLSSMIEYNILDKPVEEVLVKKTLGTEKMIAGAVNEFGYEINGTDKVFSLRRVLIANSTSFNLSDRYNFLHIPPHYDEKIAYKYNDMNGKPRTISVNNGANTSYIYSYKNQYPIAEIKNADYSTIESVLGGSAALSSLSASSPTDAEVNTLINTLKNSSLLKDAQITSYTYKPLVGITSSTDAKGMTTYYEYDLFQRLKTVKDQNGNILKQTDYHYKN
jgi:YD repeat-containing protein